MSGNETMNYRFGRDGVKIPMRNGYLRVCFSKSRRKGAGWVKLTRVCSDGLFAWSCVCRWRSVPGMLRRHRGQAARSVAFRAGRLSDVG